MITKANYIPSLLLHNFNENLLRDWLSANCRWNVYESGDKDLLYADFTAFCGGRNTTPMAQGYLWPLLGQLGYEVGNLSVRGILLKPKEDDASLAATAAVQQPGVSQRLQTVVTSELITANSGPSEPEQPKEVVFVSAKGAM
jgi:hypothetical protein